MDWNSVDARYQLQTQWSSQLRQYLYRRLRKERPLRILEAGCGTGAVIRCVQEEIPRTIEAFYAVDIDPQVLIYAANRNKNVYFSVGDGEHLPFPDGCFDFVYCHYVLLWVKDPAAFIREMVRVTGSGGITAALAEPCYAEMQAFPENLCRLAYLQRQKLANEGADLTIGRQLGRLFRTAGAEHIEFAGYEQCEMPQDYLKTEIAQMLIDTGIERFPRTEGETARYFVPTYYSFAEKDGR